MIVLSNNNTYHDKKKVYKMVFISIIISFSIIIAFQFFHSIRFSFFKDVLTIEFLIGLSILILIYLIDSLRLDLFLKFFGYKVPFKKALKNIFFGRFFTFITPMSIGGQPYQIYHLSKIGIKTEDATNIIISRTLEMSFTVLIIDVIAIKPIIKAYPKSFGMSLILTGFFVSLGISILILIGFVNKKFLKNILSFFGKFSKHSLDEEKIINWVDSLHESIKNLWVKNPWLLMFDFIMYFITVCLYTFILYLFVRKFYYIPFSYLLGIMSLLNSIAYYIPTPGSSGGIEGTYQVVFSQIFGGTLSIRLITIYRLITFYIPLLLGTILFAKYGFNDNDKDLKEG